MGDFKVVDSYHGQVEIVISHEEELRGVLEKLISQKPRIVLLVSPDSGILTLGIGESYGFVEHMDGEGNPPYLIATQDTPEKDTVSFVEFDSGGTPTPIPVSNCLPINNVIEIAIYYFRKKELPKFIHWEEV